jgi:hypothetical protein
MKHAARIGKPAFRWIFGPIGLVDPRRASLQPNFRLYDRNGALGR